MGCCGIEGSPGSAGNHGLGESPGLEGDPCIEGSLGLGAVIAVAMIDLVVRMHNSSACSKLLVQTQEQSKMMAGRATDLSSIMRLYRVRDNQGANSMAPYRK